MVSGPAPQRARPASPRCDARRLGARLRRRGGCAPPRPLRDRPRSRGLVRAARAASRRLEHVLRTTRRRDARRRSGWRTPSDAPRSGDAYPRRLVGPAGDGVRLGTLDRRARPGQPPRRPRTGECRSHRRPPRPACAGRLRRSGARWRRRSSLRAHRRARDAPRRRRPHRPGRRHEHGRVRRRPVRSRVERSRGHGRVPRGARRTQRLQRLHDPPGRTRPGREGRADAPTGLRDGPHRGAAPRLLRSQLRPRHRVRPSSTAEGRCGKRSAPA